MANSPIWMRERGHGNLEPLSPYAHDEVRNTFKPGYLGQRGGSNGLGKLPALAESFGGGITVLTDSTDPNVLAAIEAFRRQMENTYPDENLLHTLVCVPTFAPRTCLRRPSGAIRMHNKTLSLLVSKRFVDYTTEFSYHFSSALSLESYNAELICYLKLFLSRPTQYGSEFPSRIALASGEDATSYRDNPWYTNAEVLSPFLYASEQYDGPFRQVYIPADDPHDNNFPVVCTRETLANEGGFRDDQGRGTVFIEHAAGDFPTVDWFSVHTNRYALNMDPEVLYRVLFDGVALPGAYYDAQGDLRALSFSTLVKRISLNTLLYQPWWQNDVDVPPQWVRSYADVSHTYQRVYGSLEKRPVTGFERTALLEAYFNGGELPVLNLRVKVEGSRWDRLTLEEQKTATHTITVTNLADVGGYVRITSEGSVLAEVNLSPHGSADLSFRPGQFEDFRRNKAKTFQFETNVSFVIGSQEELATFTRTPFQNSSIAEEYFGTITDQIYL